VLALSDPHELPPPDVADITHIWVDGSVQDRGLERQLLEWLVAEDPRCGLRRLQMEMNERFNDTAHAHLRFALDLD